MKVIKKTLHFTNPTHAEILLLALLDVAYHEALMDRGPRLIYTGRIEDIKPHRKITILRGLVEEESPDMVIVSTDVDTSPTSVLTITDFSNESLIDICSFLLFDSFMFEYLKNATRYPGDLNQGKIAYLKEINKMAVMKLNPRDMENEEDFEYHFKVQKLRPSVISKANRRNNGDDAIPKKITRTVTLCMRVNKKTGDYSIGHAICNHHYDKPTELGNTISKNRSQDFEDSMVYQKLDEMGRVCFKPILLTQEGRDSVLDSLLGDMENNFSKYVAAYRDV